MKKFKILKILAICIMSIFVFTACSRQTADDRFGLYKESWQNKDYAAMYDMLTNASKAYISKEDFIAKYKSIYDEIGAKNITIMVPEESKKSDDIRFNLKMDSLAGEIAINDYYRARMVKEKQGDKQQWFVDWNEKLIFPEMKKEDKVIMSTIKAKRGEIYGKSGAGLAINGMRYSIKINPEQYDVSNTPKLAGVLDIDEAIINKKLEKNTDLKQFIPIVTISVDDRALLSRLLEIPGIKNEEAIGRIYPGGEAFGSLIGYLTPITSEELAKDKDNFYHSGSLVGKFGLETVYEKTLRAKDGKEVYISRIQDGKETDKEVMAKTEPEDGKNLNITVDVALQKKIYEEMTGDTGASTAIEPKTGEILAMVSSPSFDSNIYATYLTNTQKARFENKSVDVFHNRFNKSYSPGSTFKMITSTIGLETGAIDPNEKISIQGMSWRKDGTWGNYRVNRVSDRVSNVDLNDALVYSDNIYFAKAALKIGAENFITKAKGLGFGEEIPVTYPMAKSQITTSGKFESDILLADTGYGQGQVLMSPLHLSMIYSSLVNDGNIMEPILETKAVKEGEIKQSPKIWKEKVISEENKNILLKDLTNVIEDPNGTGHSSQIQGIKLAGKTGTAELKQSKDEKGKENGWFIAMNVDDPRIVVSMIIEDVGERGGSHFTIPKVRNAIDYYLRNSK